MKEAGSGRGGALLKLWSSRKTRMKEICSMNHTGQDRILVVNLREIPYVFIDELIWSLPEMDGIA